MYEPNATADGYCARCGARKALHLAGSCPDAWRPDTLAAALASLDRAKGLGDQAAMFVARGEVQRQARRAEHSHPDTNVPRAGCLPCEAMAALA